MKTAYVVDGKTYVFTNVHAECGMLYGECITKPHYGKEAWLDPNGFQFRFEPRVEATEIPYEAEPTFMVPHGYHYWGGELRNNAEWRNLRGRRW